MKKIAIIATIVFLVCFEAFSAQGKSMAKKFDQHTADYDIDDCEIHAVIRALCRPELGKEMGDYRGCLYFFGYHQILRPRSCGPDNVEVIIPGNPSLKEKE